MMFQYICHTNLQLCHAIYYLTHDKTRFLIVVWRHDVLRAQWLLLGKGGSVVQGGVIEGPERSMR